MAEFDFLFPRAIALGSIEATPARDWRHPVAFDRSRSHVSAFLRDALTAEHPVSRAVRAVPAFGRKAADRKNGPRDVGDLYKEYEVTAFLAEDRDRLPAYHGRHSPSGVRVQA